MYHSVHSRICIDGELSREINGGQGIRQGAENCTGILNARGTKTLDTIATPRNSVRIGAIKVGAPTCADGTCLLFLILIGAQTALLIAQDDATREWFQYSELKTKVML